MAEAQEISDRVAILHEGVLIALGTPDELIRLVPGQETVRLVVGPLSTSDSLLLNLATIPGVGQGFFGNEAITLPVASAADTLSQVLTAFMDPGIAVRSLSVHQPDLESVFLHLTGRPLVPSSN
jgi:ABC-2 type transport system ATP-binding protein